MKYETLHCYIMLCKLHGWAPSINGLKAFAEQLRTGMRERWIS